MMSPTPSTESVVARSVEGEEDELTMWGKLIVKKLRKFKDKQKMEDVQNHIHVLITARNAVIGLNQVLSWLLPDNNRFHQLLYT